MSNSAPIGIFDSGVGGVSVLREIRRELPHEDLLYVADSAHAPYGDKSPDFITGRAFEITDFLVAEGAKAIVVACNTATGVAVDALRARWTARRSAGQGEDLPIVAIEPAIKPAVARTRSGIVGVLATSQTIASARFARLVDNVGDAVQIIPQACPGLVEKVEEGALGAAETRALVERYVAPVVARGADTLVLGCTHYPLIADVIRSVAGPGVEVLDPAGAVARELRRRLEERGLLETVAREGTVRMFSTGPAAQLRAVLARVGVDVDDVRELGRG